MHIPKGGIAFFDSGIGGMTVLKECEKLFKNQIFYYYGDNIHAPYGNKSPQHIKKYVRRAFDLFQRLEVKVAVIACNTVTAICIEELRREYSFPIIGAEPAVLGTARKYFDATKLCLDADMQNLRKRQRSNIEKERQPIYILTTQATYESARFYTLCKKAQKYCPNVPMVAFPCKQLAKVIEKNILNEEFDYRPFLPSGKPRAVVLGCTHYIFIKKKIEGYYHCPCVDGNEGIARRLKSVLDGYIERTCWPIPDERGATFFEKEKHNNHFSLKNQKNVFGVTTLDPKRKLPLKSHRKNPKIITNKCSYLRMNVSVPMIDKGGGKYIIFCGSGKRRNAFIYKQMFVFHQKKS